MKKPSIIRIAVAGAAGRMGQAIVKTIPGISGTVLSAAIEAPGHPDIGKDAGTIAGCNPMSVKITDNLEKALESSDVLIDFTFHTAIPSNMRLVTQYRRAAVIGTTGLTEDEKAVVVTASLDVPVVSAPNMSLGVNLLFAFAKKAAESLGLNYKVQIDETHHIHKKDAPSGTALGLGHKIAEGWQSDFRKIYTFDEDNSRTPADGKILIRSKREGEVVGDHTVVFENSGETITLSHSANNREAFALGAVKAAAWIVDKRPGLYDMQDVLGLK